MRRFLCRVTSGLLVLVLYDRLIRSSLTLGLLLELAILRVAVVVGTSQFLERRGDVFETIAARSGLMTNKSRLAVAPHPQLVVFEVCSRQVLCRQRRSPGGNILMQVF